MKKGTRISEAEREVMELLWERSPLATPEVVEALAARKGWHSRTIRTLLDRLVRKGALAFKVVGKRYHYRPLIDREASTQRESRSFLQRVFGGEPAPMLLSLVRQAELTPDQIRELRRILDEKEQ